MLDHLTTEQRNPQSESIDTLSAREIVELMNREDAIVAQAVATQTSAIAAAVDVIVQRMSRVAGCCTLAPARRGGWASWMLRSAPPRSTRRRSWWWG